MTKRAMIAAMLGLALLAEPLTSARAAVYAQHGLMADLPRQTEPIRDGGWLGPYRYGPHYGGPSGWYGPRYGYARPLYGGRYVYARPWVYRPYYGRFVAGVALGTLVTVAVVGVVPPRPAPHLCWYWADPYMNRGYWDYCH
jgi:hypothetical protein